MWGKNEKGREESKGMGQREIKERERGNELCRRRVRMKRRKYAERTEGES